MGSAAHDLIPKGTAYDYFAAWDEDGTWQKVVDSQRGQIRTAAGREETPSAACEMSDKGASPGIRIPERTRQRHGS